MTARRFLPLARALLVACLAAGAFEARAVEVIINDAVTRTNNNVILDGDDKITINKGGSITVDATSPETVGPDDISTFERNTAVLLRGVGSIRGPDGSTIRAFVQSSSNNTVTNRGTIRASGANAEGVNTVGQLATNNTVINHGAILVSGNNVVGVLLGQNSRVINHGRIVTSGMTSSITGPRHGITVHDGSTITNNSLIDTASVGPGMLGRGAGGGVTLNNNAGGRIIQRAPDSLQTGDAVAFDGTGNMVNNAGRIEKFGGDTHGINFRHNAANSNNELNNSGMIITNDDASIAVLFGPETFPNNSTGNKLNNTGTIETKGDNANAVQGDSGNTITNGKGGVIKTAGRLSRGIELDDNNTITNDGTIETTGRFAYGIEVDDGNRITIGKDGKIKTSGFFAHGISSGLRTGNNTIINNGEISVSGDQSRGIQGRFAGGGITNNGRITTSGPTFANAINIFGDGAKITNTGVIQTKGSQSRGISANSDNDIIHTGTITTEGRESAGIRAENNNTLTLNGDITTAGSGSHGVLAGMNTTLNPIGPNSRIQTMAADADGLRVGGLAASQTTLIHRGHIEAGGTGIRLPYVQMFDNSGQILGMNGAGLHFTMVNGPMTLTNTGTIAGRTGIRIDRTGAGANISIDNAGTLRALQGASGTALDLRGQGQDTLHLRAGSILEGQIRWDGEGDLLRLEALEPTRLTFIDNDAPANEAPTAFTVNKPQGLLEFRSTMTSNTRGEAQTTLTLLNPAQTDPRTEATQSLWTGAIFQSLAQQQIAQRMLNGAANHRSAHTVPRSALWVRPFGGQQNYKRAGQTPAARYRYGGALAGYGMATSEWQAGAFVGAARSALKSRDQGANTEGREVFLGAYGQTRWQDLEVSVAVLLGQSRHDTAWLWRDNRASGGVARREYAGKHDFISPELGLSTHLNIQGMTLIPELKLRYLGLFNAEARARQAEGLSFKPEDRHIGLIRASLGIPLSFPENQYGGRLSGQLRVGAEGRKRLGGDRIAIRSGNDTVRYRARSDNAIMGFVGAGFEYGVSALNLSFSAEVEAGYDSEAALGVRGQFGFVWGF